MYYFQCSFLYLHYSQKLLKYLINSIMKLQNCPQIHTQDSLYSLQSLTVFVCGVCRQE